MTTLKLIFAVFLATVGTGLVGCSGQDSGAGATAPAPAPDPNVPAVKKGANAPTATPMAAPPGTQTGTPGPSTGK